MWLNIFRVDFRVILLLFFCVPLASVAQTSWRGTTSTNWATASNWTNGVPDATKTAIIGDASFTGTFQPSISSNSNCLSLLLGTGTRATVLTMSRNITIAGDLTIGGNGTLIQNGRTIDIAGSWTNNGLYQFTGTAQVTFSGNNQSVSGATTFFRVDIDGTSTLVLSSPVIVLDRIRNNGTIDPGSNLLTVPSGNFAHRNGATLIVRLGTFFLNYSDLPSLINNNSTVEYVSSTIDQTVTPTTYGNLILSGTSLKNFSIGTTSANSITNNSILSIPSGATLSLTGNWTNNGTLSSNLGTIEFAGVAAQQITGTSSTEFNNLTISNSSTAGVSVETNQTLRGVLTLAAGATLDADGTANNIVFTLLSSGDNPTVDGHIAILPAGASIVGNVTIQRYMSLEGRNSNRIYRYISSPLQDGSVADIQNEIPITGTFTGSSVCSGCTSAYSMFSYDESVVGDLNSGYTNFPISSNTETLTPARGYAMFVRGNILGSAMWDVRGQINAANVSAINFPVTYTNSSPADPANDGWNLVGNPFPSTIDWNAATGWTKTNLDATIYIPDNGGSALQYATWNGVTGTNGGSRYIAMGQGFWVKANGAGVPALTAGENVKAAATQTTFFKIDSPSNLLRVTLSRNQIRDEAVIHFRDDASEEYDSHADARKLPNATFNLSSQTPKGEKLAINSLPPINCGTRIPLATEGLGIGTYQLSFSEFESFGNYVTATLHDNWLGISSTINSQNTQYDFTVTSQPASKSPDRFAIEFFILPLTEPIVSFSENICAGQNLSVSLLNTRPDGVYTIKIEDGPETLVAPGSGSLDLDAKNLATGQHQLVVMWKSSFCDIVLNKEFQFTVNELPSIIEVGSTPSCGPGPVTLRATADEAVSYLWFDSSSSITPVAATTTGEFQTDTLFKTRHFFVSTINSYGCESDRVTIKAEVINMIPAKITNEEEELVSNYTENINWLLNDRLLEHKDVVSIIPKESGVYKLIAEDSGCTSTDVVDFMMSPAPETDSSQTIYPNPFHDKVTLSLKNYKDKIVNVSIANNDGIIIYQNSFENSTGAISVDLNSQPAGIYHVLVQTPTSLATYKLIKSR